MKKLTCFLLVLLMLSLCACQEEPTVQETKVVYDSTEPRGSTVGLTSSYQGTIEMKSIHSAMGKGISTTPIVGVHAEKLLGYLNAMKETGETVGKISDEEFRESWGTEFPVADDTIWIVAEDALYRITDEKTKICRVESHYGAGVVLEASEEFYAFLDIAGYSENTYSATYREGTLTVRHIFAADSSVQVTVKDIHVVKEKTEELNTITLELVSDRDQTVDVRIPDVGAGCLVYDGDAQSVKLKEGKAQTVVLSFGGAGYAVSGSISVANTRISLSIRH